MNYELKIAWLYPDLMSTYGDRGNVIILQKRCQFRGIEVNIENITLETPLSKLKSCSLVFMGGAQDRQQKIVSLDFLKKKSYAVSEMINIGIPALFVCAAYQFAGHYYRPYQGDDIPGAGIFDLITEHQGNQAKRLTGNVAAELVNPSGLNGKTIVGFENHGGRTKLGAKTKPLAKVLKGYGNNGSDGYEGAVYKNAIGSYFHGPILPNNPHLADWLIAKALEVKYKEKAYLKPLDDALENQAHNFMLKKLVHRSVWGIDRKSMLG